MVCTNDEWLSSSPNWGAGDAPESGEALAVEPALASELRCECSRCTLHLWPLCEEERMLCEVHTLPEFKGNGDTEGLGGSH